jgi:hypothetical protein
MRDPNPSLIQSPRQSDGPILRPASMSMIDFITAEGRWRADDAEPAGRGGEFYDALDLDDDELGQYDTEASSNYID